MKSVHQYTCTVYSGPDPAPNHPQYKSVALPGVAGTGYKHMSRILFKVSLVI